MPEDDVLQSFGCVLPTVHRCAPAHAMDMLRSRAAACRYRQLSTQAEYTCQAACWVVATVSHVTCVPKIVMVFTSCMHKQVNAVGNAAWGSSVSLRAWTTSSTTRWGMLTPMFTLVGYRSWLPSCSRYVSHQMGLLTCSLYCLGSCGTY